MKLVKLKSVLMGTAMCLPMMSMAQEVTLTSTDRALEVSGELLEYQDNVYVIRSNIGTLRIAADGLDCSGVACPVVEVLDQEVTFSGSDTVGLGLVPLLLAGYAADMEAEMISTDRIEGIETNVQFVDNGGFGDLTNSFRVRSTVSSDAFSNLLGRSAEIGLSSRRIKVEEARVLRDSGSGSMVSPKNEHILANDSIIVVTHPSNPVKSLTTSQLAGIYDGTISNWNEVGGHDAQITAVHLSFGSGTRSVFEGRILNGSPSQPVNGLTTSSTIEASNHVLEDENAIGYLSLAFKRGTQSMTLVNDCGIPMEPNEFSTKTGEYMLQRPLYFYTRGDTNSDQTKEFLEWAKTGAADSTITKSGFIDLGVETRAQGSDSTRATTLLNTSLDAYEMTVAEDLIETMSDYDRLSSTFRLAAGSSRLTPHSRDGLERFVNFLADQPAGDYLLVGFTDDQGPFDANLQLSLGRAESMVEEIRTSAAGRLDHINFSAKGYGELAPADCNTTKSGRAINRRVEVWSATTNVNG